MCGLSFTTGTWRGSLASSWQPSTATDQGCRASWRMGIEHHLERRSQHGYLHLRIVAGDEWLEQRL